MVEEIVRLGADINIVGPDGWTALHLAAAAGRKDLITVLMQHGAATGAKSNVTSVTALHVAAQNGYSSSVEQLLQTDVSQQLQQQNVDGWTAFHMAAACGHVEVMRLLIGHSTASPDAVNIRNKDNCSALDVAVQHGQSSIAAVLLDHGAAVTAASKTWSVLSIAVDNDDQPMFDVLQAALPQQQQHQQILSDEDCISPLHVAIFNRKVQLVRYLVANGTDVNSSYKGLSALHLSVLVEQNSRIYIDALTSNCSSIDINVASERNHRQTALHCAASNGNLEALRALLETKSIDVNIPDSRGWTALHVTASRGNEKATRLLLTHDQVEINQTTNEGHTSLHLAVVNHHAHLVTILAQHCANMTATAGEEKLEPIHLAAVTGNADVAKVLISHGATLETTTAVTGRSCLHLAARCGNTEFVKYLLQRGSDVNMTSTCGWTGLHCAARGGHSDVIVQLLQQKACDELVLDDNGATALYIASAHGHHDAVSTLLANGTAATAKCTVDGWSPLDAAAHYGHDKTVQVLLQSKEMHVNNLSRNSFCQSPLHVASEAGHQTVVQTLIKHGADTQLRCARGLTPLYVAAGAGHVHVVAALIDAGADVNAVNGSMLRTALHDAATGAVAELLVRSGADLNKRDGPGRTAFKAALHQRRSSVADVLQTLMNQPST